MFLSFYKKYRFLNAESLYLRISSSWLSLNAFIGIWEELK